MFQSSFFYHFQVERAPEEDVAETNQDHTEDANVPVPSPKIKKGKKGKAVPEIVSGDGAENETVPEELKPGPSEPSPKAKKGKKKNAKNVQEEASTSDVKPAADEEAMASENIAIPEESEPSKEAVEVVPEITGGKEAKNETVLEELKSSETSPKAKKGKKKNAKIVQEEASISDVKPAAEEGEEAMASENKAIPEESEPSKDAVPEISGVKEAENVTVPEEPSEPSAPTAKPKKGKKKNAKIVQGEASTSDVKPAADESQIVSIPKESEGDAEIASVPEPEPSPNAKKGKKNAKNAPEKKGKKKNVVAEEVIEDVDTNEAVSAKDPEEGADAVEDMEVSSETVDSTTKASEEVDEKVSFSFLIQ